MPKPSLLYVTAAIPATTGGASAMHSGIVLECLAAHYRVSLLAAPLDARTPMEALDYFQDMCERVVVAPANLDAQDRIRRAGEAYRDEQFEVVHVCRLAALPFARAYLRRGSGCSRLHLDLDEIESRVHQRLATLHLSTGNVTEARREKAFATHKSLLETIAYRTFDRIYVCSELERGELLNRYDGEVCALKNVVRPPAVVRPPDHEDVCRFLFVGTLTYYPNEDAVRFFCEQILPLIRRQATRAFVVDIVGGGDHRHLLDLAAEDIQIVGPVADVQPWYESAHAVIVPLRAGGGTRIKILEAFAYRRPVVTTTIGIEGIEARPNEDVLVADTSEDFAAACLRLMSDPMRARELVENASRLLTRAYTIDELKKTVSSFVVDS